LTVESLFDKQIRCERFKLRRVIANRVELSLYASTSLSAIPAIRPLLTVSLPIGSDGHGIALSDWHRGAGGLRVRAGGYSF
jgi:hypothetical protein